MVIGHPTVNDTVEANLQGGGAPSEYGEIGPVLTARAVVQMNNFLPEEGPDARLAGVIPFGKPISFLPATVTPECAVFDRFEPVRNIKIPAPDDLSHRYGERR